MKGFLKCFFVFSCLFALLLTLSGADPNNEFSWRSYVAFVTENIQPIPRYSVELSFNGNILENVGTFFVFVWQLLKYPVEVVICIVNNVGVILFGMFPVVVQKYQAPDVNGNVTVAGTTFKLLYEMIFPEWFKLFWR